MITVGILTISDSSFKGLRKDQSGPVIYQVCKDLSWEIVKQKIVPDDIKQIINVLSEWTSDRIQLIFTTGGTGLTQRDVTPEATMKVIDKLIPGIPELMRLETSKITKYTFLSRALAGIAEQTLIVNLPGSPKAVGECLSSIVSILPHALEMLEES